MTTSSRCIPMACWRWEFHGHYAMLLVVCLCFDDLWRMVMPWRRPAGGVVTTSCCLLSVKATASSFRQITRSTNSVTAPAWFPLLRDVHAMFLVICMMKLVKFPPVGGSCSEQPVLLAMSTTETFAGSRAWCLHTFVTSAMALGFPFWLYAWRHFYACCSLHARFVVETTTMIFSFVLDVAWFGEPL